MRPRVLGPEQPVAATVAVELEASQARPSRVEARVEALAQAPKAMGKPGISSDHERQDQENGTLAGGWRSWARGRYDVQMSGGARADVDASAGAGGNGVAWCKRRLRKVMDSGPKDGELVNVVQYSVIRQAWKSRALARQ